MNLFSSFKACTSIIVLSTLMVCLAAEAAVPAAPEINQYIHASWDVLTRSTGNCETYYDTKVDTSPYLYFPYNYPIPKEIQKLKKQCRINIAYLPKPILRIGDVKTNEVNPSGLLYLPYPYVVPGGRFNEMYGWDSYFVMLGLLHDKKYELANNILENYFFEIKYYGTILNANRTYHLSRSQPPFLTSAILAMYVAQHRDNKWLSRAYTFAKQDYAQWTSPPFLAGDTSLSRYYDVENIPLIEEKIFPNYYGKVISFIRKEPQLIAAYMDQFNTETLSGDYYQGERSLRASGFDITHRFGLFGGETHHYAPVCLNSLLYKSELDLAFMAKKLHKYREAKNWRLLANRRKQNMQKYFWNAKEGMFVDYDFVLKRQSTYHYATAFYPLWAGFATSQQAAALVKNLKYFEQAGGLAMSDKITGVQWDLPYGWAPIHLLTIQGLRHYHYNKIALRIARKFNHTVQSNFVKTQKIFEKYNVVDSTSDFTINIGYVENVVGFGWTNATYLLLDDLLKKQQTV